MDYINSHTTSLSTDLKLDPESRSRSRTVRPTKGGGVGERGGTCGLYCTCTLILPHSQLPLNLILSPEPLQRTSSCAQIKQKKCLNIRISKDQ